MKFLFFSLLLLVTSFAVCQKPEDGTYTYKLSFTESKSKSSKAICVVRIQGDSITIIHAGKGHLSGKNGDIIDQGIIMKHKKSHKWIIGHSPEDRDAKEIGGCTDGPLIIDFRRRRLHMC